MKKIFQDLKTGKTSIEEVPMPNEQPNKLLIRSKVSLISPGTEKMLLDSVIGMHEYKSSVSFLRSRARPHQ